MRTKSFSPLLFFSLLAVGCGQTYVAGEETLMSSSLGPPTKLIAYDCSSQNAFNVPNGTKFQWQATKLSGEVVTGVHSINGTIVGGIGSPTSPQLLLDFNPGSLSTGVDLRNQRIIDKIFNLDLGNKLQFSSSSLTQVSGSANWPAVGESSVYTVAGNLSISGISTALSFNVVVTGTADGLRVTPQSPLMLDVRTTLGLSAQVAELLALVPGVDMQSEVKFDFSIPLEPGC